MPGSRNIYKHTIAVYEKTAQRYRRKTAEGTIPEFEKFLKIIRPGGTVLDVGCAWGRDARRFLDRGYKVIGIEPVRAFVNQAKRHAPGMRIIQANVQDVQIAKNSIDTIWANAVLLHLSRGDILRVIKKFHVWLRPGGILHLRMKWGHGQELVADPLVAGHRRLFTYVMKDELVRMVRRAGFTIIQARLYPDVYGRGNVRWVGVWARKL